MQNLFIISLLFGGNETDPTAQETGYSGRKPCVGGLGYPKLGQKTRGVKKRVKQAYVTVRSLQVLNVISHFLGFKDFPYQHQSLNDIAKTPCVLTTVSNACK